MAKMLAANDVVIKKTYFPELDFIKAAAILMVFALHYFGQPTDWHLHVVSTQWLLDYWKSFQFNADGLMLVIKFVVAYFYMGVNMFVIASGFGLYLSYLKGGAVFSFGDFLKRRLFKLLPAAILAMGFIFFMKGIFLKDWPIQNLVLNILPFLGGLNLFNDNWFFPPINGEMWFFGLIVQLYLCFPILIWLYRKLGDRVFLLLLFVISVIFRAWYYHSLHFSITSISYGLSVGRLFEFGFGMVMAKKLFNGQKISRWWSLGVLMFLGYFYSWSAPFADSLMGIGVLTLFYQLAVAIQNSKMEWLKKMLNDLANQSYMIFLTHHPFIWLAAILIPLQPYSIKGLGVFILLCSFCWVLAKGLNKILAKVIRP